MENYKILSIHDYPFSVLIKKDQELRELRAEYKDKPAKERWMAADFNYGDTVMREVLMGTMLQETMPPDDEFRGYLRALAIDPKHAGALLSVGSMEYIEGRFEECMKLYRKIPKLPKDTEELKIIISKACEFLYDNEEYSDAIDIYLLAIKKFPDYAEFYDGLGYCHGKLGDLDLAIEYLEKAVELEPENHEYLSNLGWSYIDVEEYDKAEKVLKKSLSISPDYDLAKNNLDELEERRKSAEKKKG